MSVPPPPQHPPPRRTPPQDVQGESLTTQLYAGGEGDSTQMLSMDELRQIAAESRIESVDGPREGAAGESRAPGRRAGADDQAYAEAQAPPQVFSPHIAPGQSAPPAPYPQQAHGQQAYGSQPPAPPAAPPPGYTGGPADGRTPRRRMPPLAIAFVVIAALVVMGIGGWITYDVLSRGDSSSQAVPAPPDPPPSEDEDEIVEDDATEAPQDDAESFMMPSGNIGCTIDEERARCVIKQWDYDPPEPPESCSMDGWGSIVVANREGAGFSCTEAPFPSDASALEYGQSVSAHGMRCESSEEGVRCESEESGAGFSIARSGVDFAQA